MAEKPEVTMFVRKASGLVKAWSVFDGFIYSFFSVNLITLGLYIFASGPSFPGGNLVSAIIIASILILAEVAVYAMLVAVMARAGGDYVWQSRILGGGIGFVLCMAGWVFILWHWVPVYGTILSYEVFTPLLVILGGWFKSAALLKGAMWFSGQYGLFLSSVIVIGLAFLFVGGGMKWYARIQKVCFFVGSAGLLLSIGMLLFSTKAGFINGLNQFATHYLGLSSTTFYQDVVNFAATNKYAAVPFGHMAWGASFSLIPLIVFWNLWPNWGATLYGEVRGATDFKRNFYSMAAGLLITGALAIILLALFAHTFGWNFYNDANFAFYTPKSPMPVFPYPGLLIAALTSSPLLQLVVIITLSAWFFGWCGTVFLSSTRVAFAAAFDRVLPEWVAQVSPRTRAPLNALLVMAIPALIVSFLYSFTPSFATFTLDTTVVIAITYLGTTIAGIILPFKEKELYQSSPIAKYKILGMPAITVVGVIFLLFLGYNLFMWISNSAYGINNVDSALYMLGLYVLAVVVYLVSRGVRRRQGIDLDVIYKNIPVE